MTENKKSFWDSLLNAPAFGFEYDNRPLPETKVINNYYVYNENKIVQLNERDFKKFANGQHIEVVHDVKLLK